PIDPTFTQEGDTKPFFTGMEFIEVEDLQNLGYVDGAGNVVADDQDNDPGWIHLAEYNGDLTSGSTGVTYDTAGKGMEYELDIEDLLTITFTFDTSTPGTAGRWTLTTHPDVIDEAQALLGPATFDRLAWSVKAGDAFAVYSMNFKTIFGYSENTSNPYLNFLTPYQLSGIFDTSDFLNNNGGAQAISHLNVWARDPADNPVIPEPSTLILLGAGLLGLGFCARRRRK
ncbi:MAG: PEP-CTERM sorting domain-containing protein, partial [Deltaproteobacteria bacterium]|nr:PEP-CTERM sorting domain-containing protein [Candidatus Tharpella aukensis]